MKTKAKIRGMAVLLGAAVLFLFLFELGFRYSPRFAEQFDLSVGTHLRQLLSAFSGLFAFSLSGLLLLLLPVLFFLVLTLGYRSLNKNGGFRRFLLSFFSFFAIAALLFSLTLSPGYHKPPLSEKLSLSLGRPTGEELSEVVAWLSKLAEKPKDSPKEEVLLASLTSAYQKMGESYGFSTYEGVTVKTAPASPLSTLGILGLYVPPLGEITVNPDYPAAFRHFTVAHEMAHAYGFSREEEADLVAFIACLTSRQDTLIYAGAVGMLQRVLPALRESSSTLWENAGGELPKDAKAEIEEAGGVYDKATLPTMADDGSQENGHEGLPALLCAYYRSFVSPPAS